MDTLSQKVHTKIFVGVMLRPDLRLALEQSSAWQQAKIGQTSPLTQIAYHGKEYLGSFAKDEQVSVEEVRKLQNHVMEQLEMFCETLNTSVLKLVLFPQTFVS